MRWLKLFWIVLLAGLAVPAVWYSVHTPFALIDDYNSWCIVQDFSTWAGIKHWLKDFLCNFEALRSRAVYDLYCYITWTLLGTHSGLHHLARLAVKGVAAYFALRTLKLVSNNQSSKITTALLLFLSLFWFYPNCPEARLGPFETTIVASLSMCLYYTSKLWLSARHRLSISTDYCKLLFVYSLLTFSKEPCVVLTLIFLIVILATVRKVSEFALALPFVAIFIFDTAKVYYMSNVPGYGRAPLTPDSIGGNFVYYSRALFLLDTSYVFLAGVIVVALCYAAYLTRKYIFTHQESSKCISLRLSIFQDKTFVIAALTAGCFVGFFLISGTFPAMVVRYFYPLAFLLILMLALCSQALEEHFCATIKPNAPNFLSRRKWILSIASFAFCCHFVLVNYYNYTIQYHSQYCQRNLEKAMLDKTMQLMDEGHPVYVQVISEFEAKVVNYFNEYQPYYFHKKCDVQIIKPGETQLVKGDYIATRYLGEGWSELGELEASFLSSEESSWMSIVKAISAKLQRRAEPFTWVDAGSPQPSAFGRSWYIIKKAR